MGPHYRGQAGGFGDTTPRLSHTARAKCTRCPNRHVLCSLGGSSQSPPDMFVPLSPVPRLHCRVAAMPHPTWQEWYNAALVEFALAKLPERVEVACQAIHQHRIQKGHTLTAEDRRSLTMLCECCSR